MGNDLTQQRLLARKRVSDDGRETLLPALRSLATYHGFTAIYSALVAVLEEWKGDTTSDIMRDADVQRRLTQDIEHLRELT